MGITSLSDGFAREDFSHVYGPLDDEDAESSCYFNSDIATEAPGKTTKTALNRFLASVLLLDEEEDCSAVRINIDHHQALPLPTPTMPAMPVPMSPMPICPHSVHNLCPSSSSHSKRHRRAVSDADDTSTAAAAGVPRRLWVKDRSTAWWDRCNCPDFPDSEFKRAFRMSRATFDMVCHQLEAAVTKKNTMLRAAIPVRQRVAVCIWRLATGEPLRLLSKRFGLGISTCHKLVLEVCFAIRAVLMPKFLQWPDPSRMETIKREFESISRIPHLGGAMYTTHVPIIAPKTSVAAYFNKRHTDRNRRTSYSMTVQGVVDHRGVFTDACIGWPGSMRDDQVLEKSALFHRASTGELDGLWVAGKSGYPLTDWVIVPYSHEKLTWTQHVFNDRVGAAVTVAKEAFSRLKGRWACLQRRTEVKLQDLPVVLGACCVLHNICEQMGEEMEPELRFDLFDDEMVPEDAVRSETAAAVRDHIAHHLLHRAGVAPTGFLHHHNN